MSHFLILRLAHQTFPSLGTRPSQAHTHRGGGSGSEIFLTISFWLTRPSQAHTHRGGGSGSETFLTISFWLHEIKHR